MVEERGAEVDRAELEKFRPNADRSLTTLRLHGAKVAATTSVQGGGMKSLRTTGVVGAGAMGSGIAEVCALSVLTVSVWLPA